MKLLPPPVVCREAVELMSGYIDGTLRGRDRRRLEKHLAGCDVCRAYLEQLRLVVSVSGSATPEDLDPQTLDGLVDIFRQVRGDRPEDQPNV